MALALDEILKMAFKSKSPELLNLYDNKHEISRTLQALGLKEGKSYISVKSGKNILPFIVAMRGLHVAVMDSDKQSVDYQQNLFRKNADNLKIAGGSINVLECDIEEGSLWFSAGGEKCPISKFDYVECTNFNFRDSWEELAQILLELGAQKAHFLVSSYGGPRGSDDKIAKAIMKESLKSQKHAKIRSKDLLTSNEYNFPKNGVLIEIY